MIVGYTIGGEILMYMLYKIVRRDFYWWPRLDGKVAVFSGIVARVIVKIIVDFTGCFHYRHPFELGGLGFTMSMLWHVASERAVRTPAGATTRHIRIAHLL